MHMKLASAALGQAKPQYALPYMAVVCGSAHARLLRCLIFLACMPCESIRVSQQTGISMADRAPLPDHTI